METAIRHSPTFAVATVNLGPGESIVAESGAMMTMSTDMAIETQARGGFLKSLARSALGGESFFTNTFTAGSGGGQLQLVTNLPGDVVELQLTGTPWTVQSGSFLASSPSVDVDTKWGGAKTFFGGEGFIMLRCTGSGPLLVSSYGAIDRFTLEAGQGLTVDTGHLVAFEESVQFSVRKVGGLKSAFLSGEGLVVDLAGPGEVLLQTRNLPSLTDWIKSLIPTQSD